MSIELICTKCARKLKVDDEQAGKKAKCPHCGAVFSVRLQALDAVEPEPSPFSAVDGWLMQTEDGAQYGPISKTELDGWVAEGRITPNSKIKQQSAAYWTTASEIFPSLLSGSPVETSSPSSPQGGANPFADRDSSSQPNPYVSPQSGGVRSFDKPRFMPAHRGGVILGLGIAGFFCCGFLGIAAWIMGQNDLTAMNNNLMDPSGRGLTKAGMILGIIATVKFGLMILLNIARIA